MLRVRQGLNQEGRELRLHDLRRYIAAHPYRSVEIFSKLILGHANLSITQQYLDNVSEMEQELRLPYFRLQMTDCALRDGSHDPLTRMDNRFDIRI